jgi:hypothetical protein
VYDRSLILAAVDLRVLADEELGGARGAGHTGKWRCPNPDHQQTGRTPPVTIHDTHRGEQRWRCHACGDGGTAIDLIIRTRNIDIRSALQHLAARTGIGESAHPPSLSPRPTRRHDYEPLLPQPANGALSRYVDECSRRLHEPDGREILEWLTITRGLPVEVLVRNRVGADIGPRQGRPWGLPIPTEGATVLPAHHGDDLVYVQLRLLQPEPGRDRWLNPTRRLAANPRIALYQPTEQRHPEIIVTEGAIDALSAAAGGYTAVAVLGAGYVHNPLTATLLARLPAPLVLAFDPDPAGDAATRRLPELLAIHSRNVGVIALTRGDLNDHHLDAGADWPGVLDHHVRHAIHPASATRDALCR